MRRTGYVRGFLAASIVCLAGSFAGLGAYLYVQELDIQDTAGFVLLGGSTILLACAVGLYLRHRVKLRHQRQQGRPCVRCGYDLRGNTSGVCPECGGLAHYKRSRR